MPRYVESRSIQIAPRLALQPCVLTLISFPLLHAKFVVLSAGFSSGSAKNLDKILSEMNALSNTITLLSLTSNLTWPFVNVPHFDVQLTELLQSGAELIMFAPIVSQANLRKWEHGFTQEGNDTFPAVYSWLDGNSSKLTNISFQDFSIPVWQYESRDLMTNSMVNLDLATHPLFTDKINAFLERPGQSVFSEAADMTRLQPFVSRSSIGPQSIILQPIYADYQKPAPLVGMLIAFYQWDTYFANSIPNGRNGTIAFVNDTCGSGFTYMIDGSEAVYIGAGDIDNAQDFLQDYSFRFAEDKTPDNCAFIVTTHPTATLQASYKVYTPSLYTSIVLLVVILVMLIFIVYDCMVSRRQQKVMVVANHTKALVQSLFPKVSQGAAALKSYIKESLFSSFHFLQLFKSVTDRLLREAELQAEQERKKMLYPKNRLEAYLGDEGVSKPVEPPDSTIVYQTKPIADLFPEATVMFGDLVGFTAWSSTREPTQVFTLLETVYHAFDEIAKNRRVFKVETVGDCYVAVAGLPLPRKDHAIVMARFGRDCLFKMQSLTNKLECILGPDTADLGIRIGLHSGPVTAGVLRGDKSRFQLFGDTVNTAARIETTGHRNKIHISSETAKLLIDAGKGHWVRQREDKVVAKGKGELQTYWLDLKNDTSKSTSSQSSSGRESFAEVFHDDKPQDCSEKEAELESRRCSVSEKEARLIDWVTDIMRSFLQEIAARRLAMGAQPDDDAAIYQAEQELQGANSSVFDEVVESITLPTYDPVITKAAQEIVKKDIQLDDVVEEQLRDFVQAIASMYQHHPFHNFEHASHVTMSVVKLLSRIKGPDLPVNKTSQDGNDSHAALHDHTYGITSDPLTQFAVIFSAIIHDVDHPGIPNVQLVKEQTRLAQAYQNKSVAEQNSVDLAWNLLMDHSYDRFRRAIYGNPSELRRFRHLVVNTVMATDIMDKDLGALRKARWDKAFSSEPSGSLPMGKEAVDTTAAAIAHRKATIVIEHLIQASDVAHTMQHWNIYLKWNRRFFEECHTAFRQGRSDVDPARNWYQGEMGFFDGYILPLAKKLKDCGVFGVSSDEYMDYAVQNRRQWERLGAGVVAEWIEQTKAAAPMEASDL